MKSIKLNFMQHMKCESLPAKTIGRVKILKIKYIKEKPVYDNTVTHLTVGFSHAPSPRFSEDISKVKAYATVRESMLSEEPQLCIS